MSIISRISLIKSIGMDIIAKTIIKNIFSIDYIFILQRGFADIKESGMRIKKFVLLQATDEDMKTIANSINFVDDISKKEIVIRLLFYDSGLKNCYLAKTINGDIAYFQWLIYPYENDILKKYYSNRFYLLKETQVMVENAFTYPKYRGLGLMRDMTNELLKIAKQKGYKNAIIYVRKGLIDVINDRIKSGFKITKLITECKYLGHTKRFL